MQRNSLSSKRSARFNRPESELSVRKTNWLSKYFSKWSKIDLHSRHEGVAESRTASEFHLEYEPSARLSRRQDQISYEKSSLETLPENSL